MATPKSVVDITINKVGSSGRPQATVVVDDSVRLDKLTHVIQKELTRNNDLRNKLGLGSCPACTSGMDLNIRHRFDHVLQVNLDEIR